MPPTYLQEGRLIYVKLQKTFGPECAIRSPAAVNDGISQYYLAAFNGSWR